MRSARRACIVGAGSSGLAAAAVLQEREIPFDVFELGSDVGGLWRYENSNGRSPAYASLRANTSRDRTAFARLPPPDEWPDFPGHADLLGYFERFADVFRLRERITFRTQVVRVAPAAASSARDPDEAEFDVTVRPVDGGDPRTLRYGAVLVASGHHWDPFIPELPGRFDGVAFHSLHYRRPEVLRGRRVLVVGIGNSACDIACEAARVASHTFLSTRRGAHVLPKVLLGRPVDLWIGPLSSRLPFPVQRALLRGLLRLGRGDQAGSGVPVPPYPLGSEHPTISQDLLRLAREGRIRVKPAPERLEGDRVRFADGSEEEVDVLIYATGYHVSFPFLADGLVEVVGNRVPLYLNVVPPDRPGLYFLGLIQPLGAIPPLAEAQAEWVAELIRGEASLPTREAMWASIRRRERALAERFVASPRHTFEVDFYPYLRALRRERRRGRRRRPATA